MRPMSSSLAILALLTVTGARMARADEHAAPDLKTVMALDADRFETEAHRDMVIGWSVWGAGAVLVAGGLATYIGTDAIYHGNEKGSSNGQALVYSGLGVALAGLIPCTIGGFYLSEG